MNLKTSPWLIRESQGLGERSYLLQEIYILLLKYLPLQTMPLVLPQTMPAPKTWLETSKNGFYPSVNKLLWPFSSFWLAACSYPTPKQEASTLQGAKGFLLSPKIPSLLSVGAEGIRMFQEEPRFFLVHAFPLLCCQQSLKDSIWPCYTCFLKK